MKHERSPSSKEQKHGISNCNGKFQMTDIYHGIIFCKQDDDISAINEAICDTCDDNLFQMLRLINCTL